MSFRSLKVEGDVQKPRRQEIRLGCQGGPVGGFKVKPYFLGSFAGRARSQGRQVVSKMSLIVKSKV